MPRCTVRTLCFAQSAQRLAVLLFCSNPRHAGLASLGGRGAPCCAARPACAHGLDGFFSRVGRARAPQLRAQKCEVRFEAGGRARSARGGGGQRRAAQTKARGHRRKSSPSRTQSSLVCSASGTGALRRPGRRSPWVGAPYPSPKNAAGAPNSLRSSQPRRALCRGRAIHRGHNAASAQPLTPPLPRWLCLFRDRSGKGALGQTQCVRSTKRAARRGQKNPDEHGRMWRGNEGRARGDQGQPPRG